MDQVVNCQVDKLAQVGRSLDVARSHDFQFVFNWPIFEEITQR